MSKRGDVIYDLLLPVELQHSVKLNITYRNEDGSMSSRIPEDSYDNTRRIVYSEIPGQVPYDMYYVSIALISMDTSQRTITGPSIESQEKIG